MGYSPWGPHESVVIVRLHFHFSLSRNGEGNGSPLQCSFLENPREGRAWWAAVYGVAQSWTRLKRLSSSSSSSSSSSMPATSGHTPAPSPLILSRGWGFKELGSYCYYCFSGLGGRL